MGRSCGCCNPIGECDFNPCTPWMIRYGSPVLRNIDNPLMKFFGTVDRFSVNFSIEPINGCNAYSDKSTGLARIEFRKIFYMPQLMFQDSIINGFIESFGADISVSIFIADLVETQYDPDLCYNEIFCCDGLCWKIPLDKTGAAIPVRSVYTQGYTTFPDGNQRIVGNACYVPIVVPIGPSIKRPPSCDVKRNISFRSSNSMFLVGSPWIDIRIEISQVMIMQQNTDLRPVYPQLPSISGNVNIETNYQRGFDQCNNLERIVAYPNDSTGQTINKCGYGNFEFYPKYPTNALIEEPTSAGPSYPYSAPPCPGGID